MKIAQGQLLLSEENWLGTLRRHLNNIYGKLGVNGSALAILKAQQLGLVPPLH